MSKSPFEVAPAKTPAPQAEGNWLNALKDLSTNRRIVPILLLTILLLGAVFRFTGLNWDENQHLHPDERFLTMVETAIQWPSSLKQYFDTATSPLSPYNHDFGFYVYGTLPLFLVKRVGMLLNQNGYDQIHLVGRALSGLFDLASILVLFFIGRRLYGDKVALLGAALLSFTVLDIQQSHFFTVDTFANFFVVATVYFAVRVSEEGRWSDYVLMGIMLGAGVASKISVFTLGVIAALASALYLYRSYKRGEADANEALEHAVVRLVAAGLLSVLTFRVLQPIAFQGPSFFNFSLNPQWQGNMREVNELMSGARDYPPGHQWTDRPALWFPWQNMVLWGMGLPLGLAAWAGWALGLYELFRHQKLNHLLPVAYVGVVFLHQGTQWVKSMRYFMPIYPFLALLAGYLLVWVWRQTTTHEVPWELKDAQVCRSERSEEPRPQGEEMLHHVQHDSAPPFSAVSGTRHEAEAPDVAHRSMAVDYRSWAKRLAEEWSIIPWLAILLTALVLGGTLLYAIAFTSIYIRPHSRVQASRWIYNHVPKGSVLANEHWDDALPINIDGKNAFGDWYTGVTMPNYDADTPEKLNQMVECLIQADYVILSSNRLYDSIPRLPMRYPMTTRYYQLLFAEELGFAKVAEFTSYPQLFGIQIPDQSAEEAFSVYDHPKATIFKKTAAFDSDKVRHLLGDGIDWDSVLFMLPTQATKAPTALMLSPADRLLYQQAGTWSTMFDRDGWPNRFPLIAWWLALLVLGLVALPITLVTFSHLSDRGYVLSKALGLLLVSWGAWLLASWRLMSFGPGAIAVVMLLLAAASGLIVRLRHRELLAFWQAKRRYILVEEGLFWCFFLLFLLIRWANPDLWHPVMGGEKPMDFAYLNAIVRSPYFPPYDPWFAGGYINYYYFGFVLVAALIKLTGVMPSVAYNLAVPTFFALTAMGAFCVACNLTMNGKIPMSKSQTWSLGFGHWSLYIDHSLLWGLLAALFVAVLGNLGEAQLILRGLQSLSKVNFATTIPGLLALVRTLDGLKEFIFKGLAPPISNEWWYWNATRVIPHPPIEAGPITEFPFFTFVYADLHAHMMALPYTLLALALAVCVIRGQQAASSQQGAGSSEQGARNRFLLPAVCSLLSKVDWSEVLLLAIMALVVGALWPLNSWDFPTYAVVIGAALACREYWRRQRIDVQSLWNVAWRWGLILFLGYLFFIPFHQHFASAYASIELWKGSRTPLYAYLTIHGFFLFILVTYLLTELMSGQGHNALVRLLRLTLRAWHRFGRLRHLYNLLVQLSPWYILTLQMTCFAFLLVGVLLALKQGVLALSLALIVLTALLLASPRAEPRRQFMLCLIGLGLTLTLAVEVIVLKGDISRMNTVFKFYLQVWVMWGVTAAASLPIVAARLQQQIRPVGEPVKPLSSEPSLENRIADETPPVAADVVIQSAGKLRGLWWPAFTVLFAACLLYPLLATRAKINDRFDKGVGPTLDGMAYMTKAVYYDQGQAMALDWDRQAMEWMQNQLSGSPLVLEANTPLYRWGSRVSIYTGLPTVIGWDWHQKQQRAVLPGGVVERRLDHVHTIYTDPNPEATLSLLQRYGVKYIYVGPLERIYYGTEGLNKFEHYRGVYWDLVYENQEVKIYQVLE